MAYQIRAWFVRADSNYRMTETTSIMKDTGLRLLSIIPTVAFFLAPLAITTPISPQELLSLPFWSGKALAGAFFTVFLLAASVCEFVRHWRALVILTTQSRQPSHALNRGRALLVAIYVLLFGAIFFYTLLGIR